MCPGLLPLNMAMPIASTACPGASVTEAEGTWQQDTGPGHPSNDQVGLGQVGEAGRGTPGSLPHTPGPQLPCAQSPVQRQEKQQPPLPPDEQRDLHPRPRGKCSLHLRGWVLVQEEGGGASPGRVGCWGTGQEEGVCWGHGPGGGLARKESLPGQHGCADCCGRAAAWQGVERDLRSQLSGSERGLVEEYVEKVPNPSLKSEWGPWGAGGGPGPGR